VRGGSDGTAAHYEDLATLARLTEDVGYGLAAIAAECRGLLADPQLAASALLDPAGAARVEWSVVTAVAGVSGLAGVAARFLSRAASLRLAVLHYRATDAGQAAALDAARWGAGRVAGATLMAAPTASAVALGALAGARVDPQRLLVEHPQLVDSLVGASPGLLSSLPGVLVRDVPTAAGWLGKAYPDGGLTVKPTGEDTDPAASRPPTTLTDVVTALDHRDDRASAAHDQIDVRVISRADGQRAFIVDLPGTRAWNDPLTAHPATNDLGTNLHALAGEVTTRERGVAEALRQAGADRNDPVMLVGHSQGGLVAAAAAHDSGSAQFPYRVSHVVALGAPIGRVTVPAQVQLLAVENAYDIVPHLDAATNRDRPQQTTVTISDQRHDIGRNHDLNGTYLPAMRQVDVAGDPSIVSFRRSASDFLSPTATVRTAVFELGRTP